MHEGGSAQNNYSFLLFTTLQKISPFDFTVLPSLWSTPHSSDWHVQFFGTSLITITNQRNDNRLQKQSPYVFCVVCWFEGDDLNNVNSQSGSKDHIYYIYCLQSCFFFNTSYRVGVYRLVLIKLRHYFCNVIVQTVLAKFQKDPTINNLARFVDCDTETHTSMLNRGMLLCTTKHCGKLKVCDQIKCMNHVDKLFTTVYTIRTFPLPLKNSTC